MKKILLQVLTFFILANPLQAQESWHKLTPFNDDNSAVWMSAAPDFNYAITADRWIYFSTPAGINWNAFFDVPSFYNVGSIKASQVTNRVFCLTLTSGIVFTDDFGSTWTSSLLTGPNGNSGFSAQVLAYGINGTNVITSVIGPISGPIQNRFFTSVNNGVSFTELNTLPFYPTGFHFKTATEVYSNTADGIYKTDNFNNSSWNQIAFAGLTVTDFEIVGNDLYASVEENSTGKVYKSTDNGQNWTEITGIPSNTNISKISFDAVNNRLYATTKSGVFKYENNVWSTVSTTKQAHEMIVSSNQTVLFSGIQLNGIHAINPSTSVVQTVNEGLYSSAQQMMMSTDNQIYTTSLKTAFLSKFDLQSMTWGSETLFDDINDTRILSMANDTAGQCVIGGLHYIAKTSNQGDLEIIADDNSAPLAPVYNILFPYKMYLGNNGSISLMQHPSQTHVDYSTDMGLNWDTLYRYIPGVTPGFLNIVTVCSGTTSHFILGSSNQTAQNMVIVSNDEGNSWTQLPNPPGSNVRFIAIDKFNTLYVATDSKLFKWNAPNQNWVELNINLGTTSSNKVIEIIFDANNLLHVLIRTTTTSFAEEGVYIFNPSTENFQHILFPTLDSEVIPLKNLAFRNDVPFAMSNLAIKNPDAEGIYYLNESSILSNANMPDPEKWKIYPNPTQNQFMISPIDPNLTSGKMIDLNGKIVDIQIKNGIADVSEFSSGMYYLKLETTSKPIKVVVQ